MSDTELFQMALGLTPPGHVESCAFNPETKRLGIMINFPRGSTFTCPECGEIELKAHDTETKSWRHLNFFQHEAYLTARVPRVKCSQCGIRLVSVPWLVPGVALPFFLKP